MSLPGTDFANCKLRLGPLTESRQRVSVLFTGLLEAGDSTKLSPWLALGCLSPRRVHLEVARYEAARAANKSTSMITFHLLVRDYFRRVLHHLVNIDVPQQGI